MSSGLRSVVTSRQVGTLSAALVGAPRMLCTRTCKGVTIFLCLQGADALFVGCLVRVPCGETDAGSYGHITSVDEARSTVRVQLVRPDGRR